MAYCCIICNVLDGDKDTSELFAEVTTVDEAVAQTLAEILDKPISVGNVHSSAICKDCYTTCLAYESSKQRIQDIKKEFTNKFKVTLPKHGLDYNMYPKKPSPLTPKKIVLPASKLLPLPPNYFIDLTRLPKNMNLQSPKFNLKVTVGSTVLTQSLKTTQSSPAKLDTTVKSVESNIANSLSSILGMKTSTSVSSNTPILTFNVDSLPKDFMSTKDVMDLKHEFVQDNDNDDDDHAEEEGDDELNNDEQPMEIDEECTITKISASDGNEESVDGEKESDKQLFDVSLLPITEGADGATIMGKLEVLDQNDEDDGENECEEIVMTDESGSVIRFMVSGQKLVYKNGTICLADGDNPDDEEEALDDNDESQIELQVSGDEETANAIIAAAQEQGGAFIKVESGEMFRVKSVKSQSACSPPEDATPNVYSMVRIGGEEYHCMICDKVKTESDQSTTKPFDSADDIMQHLRTKHDARLYICRICKKIMRKRSEYYTHTNECKSELASSGKFKSKLKIIQPSDKKIHECTECDKRFSSKTLLQEHCNMHTGTRPYACGACGKTFASKYTHQAHLKTHTYRPRPYKCKQCPKSFLSNQNLTQHEKTHLGIKEFVCNVCGKAFGTQHNLDVHGVVHSRSKQHVCAACGKRFARRAEVQDHMRIHTGERPFACETCGASFSQRSNLHSHRRATHMDDKRHHCQDCPKRFKRRRLLDYHIKACHTGERPLRCDICHATFVYPEHYKKHARIHSGEKPFTCEVCGKSFNSRDNRNTHRFTHSDKKPYECLVCGAGYMRKQLLYAHMNTTGHLAESIVVNQPRVQKVTHKVLSEDIELATSESNSQEEKTEISLVQSSDDPAILTFIQNLEGGKDALQAVSTEHIGEQVQMVTTDENGAIRVVQLHIGSNPAAWTMSQ